MVFWVCILASQPGGTLYVGVTNDLVRRIFEHREGLVRGFTKRYGVKMLVYFEQHETAIAAIQREKNIKHWSREWKIDLIVSKNPDWRDLYDEIVHERIERFLRRGWTRGSSPRVTNENPDPGQIDLDRSHCRARPGNPSSSQKALCEGMDPRVKPAGDDVGWRARRTKIDWNPLRPVSSASA